MGCCRVRGCRGVDATLAVPRPPTASPQPPAPCLACTKHQGEHGGGYGLWGKALHTWGAAAHKVLLVAGLLAQRGCWFGDLCNPEHPNTPRESPNHGRVMWSYTRPTASAGAFVENWSKTKNTLTFEFRLRRQSNGLVMWWQPELGREFASGTHHSVVRRGAVGTCALLCRGSPGAGGGG